jgi:hypothetical protein
MFIGLVDDRCSEREEPGWGLVDACLVVPERRREKVVFDPSSGSFDDGEVL